MKAASRLILVGVMALIVLAPTFCHALKEPGLPLPELTLVDTKGNQAHLASLTKGKVALIVYWSISCPHCRVELPFIAELSRKLSGNPFVLLTVNADGVAMAEAAEAMARDYGLPEPYLLDASGGDEMPLAIAYDLVATPTVLVLNPEGVLVHAQELDVDKKALQTAIEEAF